MKFTTEVKTPVNKIFSHRSKYMLLGSCFAENMGENLCKYCFEGINNPFGILFNPISIAQGLERILDEKYLTTQDLFRHNGLWHSDLYHSAFSDADPQRVLDRANRQIADAHNILPKTDFLIITFGSSWVYMHKGKVVANCHKLPENNFVRKRLSVSDIVDVYKPLLDRIFRTAPEIKVIISVSPVRYLRDGAVDNSLNKATLLLAVEQLVNTFGRLTYFPAYEILLDELRDYRFYADDMVHPSKMTQNIVWQRFAESFFTDETLDFLPQIDKLHKMLEHNTMHETSDEAVVFKARIENQKSIVNKYLNACSLMGF